MVQKQEYFQLRQPFDYHTAVPRQNLPGAARTTLAFGTGNITTPTTPLEHTFGLSSLELTVPEGTGNAVATLAGFTNNPGALTNETLVITTAAIAPGGVAWGGDTLGFAAVVGDVFIGQLDPEQTHTNTSLFFLEIPITSSGKTLAIGSNESDNGDIGTIGVITDSVIDEARTSQMTENINVYSFALKPEEHQPSGTCNFSRIDTAILDLTGNDQVGEIYAVNYNVLRIMSGMGGLAYSN